MASKSPEHLVSENPNGIMFFSPAGSKDTTTEYNLHTKCGYEETVTKDGNRGTIIPGTYHEHVIGKKPGDNRKQKEKESISRTITVENGDICITAENGNIKLKAKNVYIETTGDGNDGSAPARLVLRQPRHTAARGPHARSAAARDSTHRQRARPGSPGG